MSDATPPEDVFALLDDEYARAILTATRSEPMTAATLADAVDAAPSTVYDRIDRLLDAGFLVERTRTDGAGNHYGEYRAALDGLRVRLTGDGLDVDVIRTNEEGRDEAAERLYALWSDLR